MRFEEVKSTKT